MIKEKPQDKNWVLDLATLLKVTGFLVYDLHN